MWLTRCVFPHIMEGDSKEIVVNHMFLPLCLDSPSIHNHFKLVGGTEKRILKEV